MRGLEHCNFLADIAGRRKTKAPNQSRERVADDIAEQVAGHDHAILFGVLGQPHGLRVDVGGPQRNLAVLLLHFLGGFFHHAGSFAQHVGLLADGHRFVTVVARMKECGFANPSRRRTRDDAHRNREVLTGDLVERFEFRVGAQRITHRLRRVRPLYSRIEAFRVLTKDHHIYLGLFVPASGFFADEVQRVAGERQARPHAYIEVEDLPHGNNRAEILIPFASQRGAQLGLSFLLRLRRDGAEQANLVLAQQLDGALGKSIAFLDPALPTDVGVYVLCLETDDGEHPNRFGQDLVANSIAQHGYDFMFCHEYELLYTTMYSSEWICHPERSAVALRLHGVEGPLITHTNRPPLSVPHCETHTCATTALNPSFRLTRFSTPPAMTSDCGTLPSAGKVNCSPA